MSKALRLLFSLIILSGFLVSPTYNRGTVIDEGIRIDVPADANIHLENRFGNITAEVWDRGYVSVGAGVDRSATLRRSPILIDNRGKDLNISVFRAPGDPPALVNLDVKIPHTSRVEIAAVSGRIKLLGVPAAASVKSASGDIEAILFFPFNTNVSARAPGGTIRSMIPAAQTSSPHFLQARLGDGGKQLDVETRTGQIVISAGSLAMENPVVATKPQLIAPNSQRQPQATPPSPNPGDQLEEGDVIRVESQLVTVNMSVIDMSTNRGLIGLLQSDFKLFENGEEQRIDQFESSSAPFDLVLLIDVSGSTKEKTKLMRDAALRFINAARPADRIGIVTFAGAPTVVSDLTADRQLLRQRVELIDTARGDTKLYDAAVFSMNSFLSVTRRSRRTAIVLMSDGLDGTIPGISDQIGSQISYRETLDEIREFDGVLYTLWLNTRYVAMSPKDTQPEAFDEAYDRMREMAEAGGGVFYEVNRLEDLAGAYERVVADLGTVYTLAYEPMNKTRDGKWRAIRIRINRANAVARGKRGYYAN